MAHQYLYQNNANCYILLNKTFAFFQILIEKEVWDRNFPVILITVYVSYEESLII